MVSGLVASPLQPRQSPGAKLRVRHLDREPDAYLIFDREMADLDGSRKTGLVSVWSSLCGVSASTMVTFILQGGNAVAAGFFGFFAVAFLVSTIMVWPRNRDMIDKIKRESGVSPTALSRKPGIIRTAFRGIRERLFRLALKAVPEDMRVI